MPLIRNMNAFVEGSNTLFADSFEPQSSVYEATRPSYASSPHPVRILCCASQACYEAMTNDEVLADLMSRLRGLFPEVQVPEPVAFYMTRTMTS